VYVARDSVLSTYAASLHRRRTRRERRKEFGRHDVGRHGIRLRQEGRRPSNEELALPLKKKVKEKTLE